MAFGRQALNGREAGRPFTRWSIRKLLGHLLRLPGRAITIGRETLRTLPARRGA